MEQCYAGQTLLAIPPMSCWELSCAAGMKGMYYVTCVAALNGTFTALLVGLYGMSRIVMVAARDWLIPPFLATIYPRTQTPVIAQVVFGLITGEEILGRVALLLVLMGPSALQVASACY